MAADNLTPDPVARKLRIFAFDPSVCSEFGTAGIGEITIAIPWEEDLQPGPVGEYIEVIDADPASNAFLKPVDLNDRRILAQDGLAPSETNPQFHQQMVYAVAMATIGHFEQALGRVALWSSHRPSEREEYFVRRLRIYPHALRDRNAYYSPEKKALLFGYFQVGLKDEANTPGTLVFTCLSHDIIAHETTHALLDGVHPRFNEPTNPDVLAFHEAFADIVAMFQHFAYPGVLRDQIARNRGDLAKDSLLAKLAQQFGRASGRGSALRNALADKPDVRALERTAEPHDRGAILVAAVFGAFLKVYRGRTLDLYRIASEGTGVLREGDIHPDLSNRLADEAAQTARYVLQMCIRAVDYCPPMGITFGDFLRGIVTADRDLAPNDPFGYRLAFLESFRQWGIYPAGMRSMSIEALLWPNLVAAADIAGVQLKLDQVRAQLKEDLQAASAEQARVREKRRGRPLRFRPWDLESDRYASWEGADENAAVIWGWLVEGPGRALLGVIGILTEADGVPGTVLRSRDSNRVSVEVHSVRQASRRSPRGGSVTELVIEVTQRRQGYFNPNDQRKWDLATPDRERERDFIYRAGCTLLMSSTGDVRRVIRTPGTIKDDDELERLRRFLTEGGLEPANAFELTGNGAKRKEPFAMLHRHGEG